MEESAIKGLGSPEKNIRESISTVSVEGYDSSLPLFPLKLKLMKHFDLCGNLSQIFIPQDLKTRTLKTPLFIDFCGEGQRDNALKLNGSDLEGWTLVVKPSPHHEDRHRLSYLSRKGERNLYVKVYDVPSSVRDIDLTIGLCDHFSSCGEVTCIDLLGHGPFEHESITVVTILGEGCVEKAKEQCEHNAQGWNIVIASVFGLPSRRNKVKLTGCKHPDILRAEMEKKEKAKMEKREKAKMEKMEKMEKAKMEKMEKAKMEKMEKVKMEKRGKRENAKMEKMEKMERAKKKMKTTK